MGSLGSFSGGNGSGYSGGSATTGDQKTNNTTNNTSGGQYISAAPAWKGGISSGGAQTTPGQGAVDNAFKYALLAGGLFVGIFAVKALKK